MKAFFIGVFGGLLLTWVIYMVWLYQGNKKLRQVNEDLKTLNEEGKLADAAHKLPDKELMDDLDTALGDSSGSTEPKPNGRA